MGHIIFWGLVRAFILIPTLWFLTLHVESRYWWSILILSVYGIIIHPAILQYKHFFWENRNILTDTLCSSCRHFDATAVICMKHDEHPTETSLPCEGIDWEPSK